MERAEMHNVYTYTYTYTYTVDNENIIYSIYEKSFMS